MGMKTWSFQDNGIAGRNGGIYGPFEFDGTGIMFLGCTSPNDGEPQGPNLTNVQIRVHPGYKPTTLTGNGVAFPGVAVDGIPLTAGQWFRLDQKVSTWYFSVPIQGIGQPLSYWFAVVDDCGFYAGSVDLQTPAVVKKTFTDAVLAVPILVANSPAMLTGWYLDNPDVAFAYLQFFDTSNPASVTPGTTVPKITLGIPPGAAANAFESSGLATFFNGIVVFASTARANGVAPGAAMDINIFFE